MTYEIREAITADIETTWVWRNDPVTRSMARVDAPVSRTQYEAWFNSVERSRRHLLLVAEHNNTLIAYAGFAPFTETGTVTISLTLGPVFRARGHGSALTPLFVRKAADYLCIKEIIAHIRTENAPSHMAFSRAGFRNSGVEGSIHRYRLPVLRASVPSTMDQSNASPRLSGRVAQLSSISPRYLGGNP